MKEFFLNVVKLVRYLLNEPRKLALNWIERGDLIMPIVIVSAAHYVIVLSEKDYGLVAAIIGVLVDLGHYRLVKSAINVQTKTTRSMTLWGMTVLGAVVMTFFAFGFHFIFYKGEGWEPWVQAAVIPTIIIFLGVLSVRERWGDKIDADNGATKQATVAEEPTTGGDNGGDSRSYGGDKKKTVKKLSPKERQEKIRQINATRNGNGAFTVAEIVEMFGVSERTAERDYAATKGSYEPTH